MSAVPFSASARRWQSVRVWLVRLAINAAGFALCYFLFSALLWAVGSNVFAPLVPRAGAFYRAGDGVMYTQGYLNTITWVTCVPAAFFALALAGVAVWRRWLWYVPGALLGLALGTVSDALAASSQTCGGAWHATPPTVALLANGLCLAVAALPAACLARCQEVPMPGSTRLSVTPASRTPALLVLLLALVSVSLVGCEISVGHHVGDTISNAEAHITLTSVTVAPANATLQPAPGDELVRLHVRLTNLGHTVWSFNEVQFAMQNGGAVGACGPDGAVDCMVPRDGTYIHAGIQGYPEARGYLLQPGATVESDIVFEVGKSAHDARLVYQPDGMQDIANFWWLLGL